MFKKSFRNSSIKSISALLSASALVMGIGLSQPAQASEPYIGEIKMFGGNFAIRGYALCDGQLLSIATHSALFSILGTTYGGDGRTTFGLPEMRGRTAVHPGTGPGLPAIRLGEKGGAVSATLAVANLPSHNHSATGTVRATDARGDESDPGGNVLAVKPRTNIYSTAAPDVDMSADSIAVTVGNTGNNSSFSVRDPFIAVNHMIALVGLFPSRD